MTTSNPARKSKGATAEKFGKAGEKEPIPLRQRANSKQADVIGMLGQPQGTTISVIMKATGHAGSRTHRQPIRHEVVTHVLGTVRNPCVRNGPLT
jgi:hypothetical protein